MQIHRRGCEGCGLKVTWTDGTAMMQVDGRL